MPREFDRTERVGAQLQRELASLVREQLKDPRLGAITIQEVRVARDLSHAKVYFTILGSGDTALNAKLLNHSAGFLRHELAGRVKLRSVPALHFVYDESIERGERLASLIDRAVDGGDEHN
ncbi:MAG: 30S ribosome-binding factor RbfA [Chromatiales bacterium]|jgi:ribosome-binding factor A